MVLIKIAGLPEEMRNIDEQSYPLWMSDHRLGLTWLKCDERLTIRQVEDFVDDLRQDFEVEVEHQF